MTVIDDTLISQQIDKATETAAQLAQWLDAAQRFQAEQAKQENLQAQVEKAQREVASLENAHAQILLTAAGGFVPVDIQDATGNLNDALLAKTIEGLFHPMLDTEDDGTANESPLNNLFSEAPADETSIIEESDAPDDIELSEDSILATDDLTLDIGEMPDFSEGMWDDDPPEAVDEPDTPLTDVFALPDAPAGNTTPNDTTTIDSLLNAADPTWMQHLETLSADDDTTTDEDLELLFKDIEDAPDDSSPWSDPWDNKFEAQSGNGISDLSLPVPAWDTDVVQATNNAPAAQPKKRGLLRQWFFRD